MTAFGIDRLRDGQPEIITTALEGESLLAVLPTGAGKSALLSVASHAQLHGFHDAGTCTGCSHAGLVR
jgi:superfamily II DNA helicase RecQ